MKFAGGYEDRSYLVRTVDNDTQEQHRHEDRSHDALLFRGFLNGFDRSGSPHQGSLSGSGCTRAEGARRCHNGLLVASEAAAARISGDHGRNR